MAIPKLNRLKQLKPDDFFSIHVRREKCKRSIRVHLIRMKFVLYCTFVLSEVLNPESKHGNNVLLFPGFVLSKYKKTIEFSITLPMLCEPGLYFLGYLGCVGRMVSGFWTISSPWSATTKTLHQPCRGANELVCCQ
jgi:hypothetical protein